MTIYFTLSTYKGDLKNDVMIGVNYKSLTVSKVRDREVILTLQLQRLKYKISTSSIFIYDGESIHRFDGQETNTIRQLIETYLCYSRLFNSKK
jgi:hypothetical protein